MRGNDYWEGIRSMGLLLLGAIIFAVISFYLNGGPEFLNALGL